MVIGCGRIGTVHEFTISYEDEKPTGILRGDWDMDEVLKMIIDKSNRINNKIIFDDTPEKLIKRIIELVGTSTESWEKAATAAVDMAAKTLRQIRGGCRIVGR